jgi:hypothetical protein
VDVLLSETVDSTGLGENNGIFMTDTGERLLAPGGVFLSQRLDCYAALAHPVAFDDQCAFWERNLRWEFPLDRAPLMDRLRTFPGEPLTHWKQGFSPFARPTACAKGDCLWLDVLMGVSREPTSR